MVKDIVDKLLLGRSPLSHVLLRGLILALLAGQQVVEQLIFV